MVSLWVYAYSEGISSAREIERLMEWEPGMQWLGGLVTVNHHTLSDFRVEHKAALDELFAELLALLESAGLVSLEQVMHDGTKIRTQAGADSFRREKSLRERLEQARQAVAQMGDPRAEAPAKDRKQAARERAARERAERLEGALQELTALQAEKKSEEEKAATRVSLNEPQARVMKHGDNAIAPGYNAQISTEASHKIIVGAHLSQCSSDAQSLMPALEEVAKNLERKPGQVVGRWGIHQPGKHRTVRGPADRFGGIVAGPQREERGGDEVAGNCSAVRAVGVPHPGQRGTVGMPGGMPVAGLAAEPEAG